MGFRPVESSAAGTRNLRHPTLDRGVSIAGRPAIDSNVVAVEIESSCRQDPTTIRVVGIEDLIADQISLWLRQGGRRREIATLVQVLVELGRAGVAGPFRQAYLRHRLDLETKGEAVLELRPASYCLDDPSPRTTSLTAIASIVHRWRSNRNMPVDAAGFFEHWHPTEPGSIDASCSNEAQGQDGLSVTTARIIPFMPSRR